MKIIILAIFWELEKIDKTLLKWKPTLIKNMSLREIDEE